MRIGFLMKSSKFKKLNWNDFDNAKDAQPDLEIVRLDPVQLDSLEAARRALDGVSVLVSKVTDDLVAVNDVDARRRVRVLEDWLSENPGVLQIDPVAFQRRVLRRSQICATLDAATEGIAGCAQCIIGV
jgi:hypothetical protein